MGGLSEDERLRREERDRVKREACSLLQARDKELNLIKEGKLTAKKHDKHSSIDREIAFQRYLDMFYKRPDAPFPEDDPLEGTYLLMFLLSITVVEM